MTPNNKSEGRNFLYKTLIVAFALIAIVGLIFGAMSVYNTFFVTPEELFKFEGIFVDINGDGLQDYVRYAEVVINKGDFTVSP